MLLEVYLDAWLGAGKLNYTSGRLVIATFCQQ
jgi:hypothetical protein